MYANMFCCSSNLYALYSRKKLYINSLWVQRLFLWYYICYQRRKKIPSSCKWQNENKVWKTNIIKFINSISISYSSKDVEEILTYFSSIMLYFITNNKTSFLFLKKSSNWKMSNKKNHIYIVKLSYFSDSWEKKM